MYHNFILSSNIVHNPYKARRAQTERSRKQTGQQQKLIAMLKSEQNIMIHKNKTESSLVSFKDDHNGITKTCLFKYTESFTTKNRKNFRQKFLIFFHISAQNIDCGYSSTTIYVFEQKKKNNVYPCKPQFYYIKVRFKGVNIISACFRDVKLKQGMICYGWPQSLTKNENTRATALEQAIVKYS